MKIPVKDIGLDWLERSWDEPAEVLNEVFGRVEHNTVAVTGPVHVEVRLMSAGSDIEVRGSVDGGIEFDCDRCCERGRQHIAGSFHYVLVPRKGHDEAGDEDDAEEMPELSYYEGDEVELSGLAIEQFMLMVPFKLLCSDGCKGLCPRCGTNLNLSSCSCGGSEHLDGPFAKLKTITKE